MNLRFKWLHAKNGIQKFCKLLPQMKKTIKTSFPVLIFSLLLLLYSCSDKPLKVACIGDSITEGSGTKFHNKSSYPVILGQKLGEAYEVYNCGRGSTTMLRNGNFPYWTCKDLYNVFLINPDIVVIKLGTNDTKRRNWNHEEYARDYQAMIDTIRSIPGSPDIYLCLPVPVHTDRWEINDSTIINGVIPIIKDLAAKNQLPVIDLNTPLLVHKEFFPDGVHPSEPGTQVMAEHVYQAITR